MALPAGVQLALLLLAVPLQYLLTSQITVSDMEQRAKAAGFMSKLQDLYGWSYEVWKSSSDTQMMVEKFLNFFMSPAAGRPASHGSAAAAASQGSGEYEDEEAIEVQREQGKWFGMSSHIRKQRVSGMEFGVGQVVQHTDWGWRGVVVGWDEQAQGPDYWLAEQGTEADGAGFKQPWYLVLVDQSDREGQTAYVPQDALSSDSRPEAGVSHPDMVTYFKPAQDEDYVYVMLPWLRERYPRD